MYAAMMKAAIRDELGSCTCSVVLLCGGGRHAPEGNSGSPDEHALPITPRAVPGMRAVFGQSYARPADEHTAGKGAHTNTHNRVFVLSRLTSRVAGCIQGD